ncbi:MAG: geranylgeranylglyceryl/heptaprenylglyceryl phosphate synthase [Bacteroidales bacterium]|nr:geranylgeranylglyceryl/heptaprenylglyceryl phosphate synthase [Bacteroidales bacterium]
MIKTLKKQRCIALLLDPENYGPEDTGQLAEAEPGSRPDFIFIGGSLTSVHPGELAGKIKEVTDIPLVLFPGNLLQLTDRADSILLLSLISGRNPELLIGNHVLAAPHLRKMNARIIPTGYILINCGVKTSVEYMSQTDAIPSAKTDIAVATAMAGEMLGLKLIYLEAGSGAAHPVPEAMIRAVRQAISVPLIVGGGIRTPHQAREIYDAGADMLVLGNGYEDNKDLLGETCRVRDSYNIQP